MVLFLGVCTAAEEEGGAGVCEGGLAFDEPEEDRAVATGEEAASKTAGSVVCDKVLRDEVDTP